MSQPTSEEMTKVIVVGPSEFHAFFTQQYEGFWDTQFPVETLEDLWTNLNNNRLDEGTRIIIFADSLYDPRDPNNTFIQSVAAFAPLDLTAITVSQENEARMPVIIERIMSSVPEDQRASSHVYQISHLRPIQDMDQAIEHYGRMISGEGEPEAVDYEEGTTEISGEVGDVDVSHNGIVVTSTSSKGGSGKSSVGFLLASQIAQGSLLAYERGESARPLKVCVVDLDTRDGQLGFLIGQTSPTALNIRLAPNWGPEVIQNNLVYDENSGLYLLLAPKRGRTAEDVGPEFYHPVINNLRSMFDVVILDTSVNYLDSLIYDVALPISDAVLFVTNLGPTSIFGMTRWFEETTSSQNGEEPAVDRAKVGVVVNQSLPNVNMSMRRVNQAAGAKVIGTVPMESQAFLTAANKNRLADVLSMMPNVGAVFQDLATKVIRRWYPDVVVAPLYEQVETQQADAGTPASSDNGQKKRSGGFFRRK